MKYLMTLIVMGTIVVVAVQLIASSDFMSSLSNLGCLINGQCNDNS